MRQASLRVLGYTQARVNRTSQIGSATIIHDSLAKIYDYLTANLTDPKAADRASEASNTDFVMMTWPELRQYYPHITIGQMAGNGRRAGGNSTMFITELIFDIDVLSLSEGQCDLLSDQVLDKMRTGIQTFVDYGMHFMKLLGGPRPIPVTTNSQVHRKKVQYSFTVFVG